MTVEYTRSYVLGIVKSRGPVSFKQMTAFVWPAARTEEDQEQLLEVLEALVTDELIARQEITKGRSLMTVWSVKK